MDIVLLSPLPPPSGGIATWSLRFKEASEEKGLRVRIVNTAIRGKRAETESSRFSIIDELRRFLRIIHDLRNELKRATPDIIHINTSCSPIGVIRDIICMKIAFRKAPVVLHCHCNISDQLGKGSLAKKAFNYLVKKAKKVIVLNVPSKKYVDIIENNKAIIIPNFINTDLINEHYDVRNEIREVVFVGHIERAKGIQQIADVAMQLPNLTFTLVGPKREDISSISFSDNVKFIGRVSTDEVLKYLKSADAFLFPTYSEGFSIALLEAMAVGLPIVTTNVGANFEMIENKGGIILDKNTGAEICKALELLSDPIIRQNMSKWNIEKVKNNYTVNNVVLKYISLYKEYLSNERTV